MRRENIALSTRRGNIATRAVIIGLAVLLGLGAKLHAQSSYTWTGGGGDNYWTTAGNWGGTAPASPQAYLNFAGSTRLSTSNNFSSGSAGFQIYFKSGAGAFTLSGNSINFYDYGGAAPNIQNEGTALQTVSFPFNDGNVNESGVINVNGNTASGGPITFNGAISVANGTGTTPRILNLAVGDGTGTITFNGAISDGTTTLQLKQLGTSNTTILAAANTYSAGTVINGGTLQLGNGSNTGNASTGTISITNGATLLFDRSDSPTFTNAISITGVSGNHPNFSVAAGTTCTLASGIATSGGEFWVNDSVNNGTLIVNNPTNTFNVSVVIVNGILQVGDIALNGSSASSIGEGGIFIKAGTYRYTGGTASSTRIGGSALQGASSSSTIDVYTAGTTLTLNAASITEDGGSGFTKVGAGNLKLANSSGNTIAGTTVVNVGTLTIANTAGNSASTVNVVNANLAGGTGDAANHNSVSGLVTTSGSAPHIQPGGVGTIGTLKLTGGLTLGGTTPTIDLDLSGSSQAIGGGTNDLVDVSGATVTVNATTTVNATLTSTPTGPVSYTIMKWNSETGSGGFSVGTISPAPTSSSLTVNSGTLVLNLTYPAINAYKITAATSGPTVGTGDQLTITAVDSGGNTVTTFNGNVALTFSGLPTTGGTPTVTDMSGTPQNQGATTTLNFVSGVASTSSGAAVLKTFTTGSQTLHVTDGSHTDTSTGGTSLTLTPVAGIAAATTVETTATGSGTTVGTQNVTAGSSITAYAIERDTYGNFVTNASASWSLSTETGGVVSGDLVAAGGGKSATFTGHVAGTAVLQAIAGGFTGNSGTLTVVAGSASQTRVETSAAGTGSVVSAQNLPIGTSITVYAIARDTYGNFVNNPSATWSLQDVTGNVTNSDLSTTSGASTTFTGYLVGSANIQALANTFTGQSGTITVTAPPTASDNACNAGYTGSGDWTGNNGGTGFLNWTNHEVGTGGGGFYRGTSTNNGGSGPDNIDTSCGGGYSWGMYSGGNVLVTDSAHITRPFTAAVQVGQSFTIDMDNGYVDSANSGLVGFVLQNSSGEDVLKFSFTGGGTTYQFNNTNASPAIPFTGDGLRVVFTLTSSTTYSATVAAPNTGAPSSPYTGNLMSPANGQSLTQVLFFTDGAGLGPNYDLFFNSMSIGNPTLVLSPASGALAAGINGYAYSNAISASGGTAPYTYAVTSGSLPGTLMLNASTGVISGTPIATNSYSFSVTATDAYGYTGSAAYTLAINAAPTAGNTNFARGPGMGLKINTANLIAENTTDAAGYTLALEGVGASGEGATITTNATYIFYSPSTGATSNNSDSFTYTVGDSRGATATGTISVNVVKAGGIAQSISSSGGAVTIQFAGIPGYEYDVQRATNVNFATYTVVLTTNVPPNGLFSFTETPPTSPVFYRLAQH